MKQRWSIRARAADQGLVGGQFIHGPFVHDRGQQFIKQWALPVSSGRAPLATREAMKKLLNHVTEGSAWAAHSRDPMTRWAAVAVLLGAGALACSDSESSPKPPATTKPADTGAQVTSAAETDGNEMVPETGDTAVGSGAPRATEGAVPELVAGGTGEPAGADSSGAATSGGAGGAGAQQMAGSGGAQQMAGSGGAQQMAGSGGASADGWVPLFNGVNLDGWVVNGTTQPLYAVENGEIHVYPTQQDQSNQPQANLRSLTSLGGKYTLHVEYKWGQARFGGRSQVDRDAGILFHITGTDVNKVWPDSLEHQLGESQLGGEYVAGDLWVLGGPTRAQTRSANGQLQSFGNGTKSAARIHADRPRGEWNTVEIIIDGAAEAIYMVNDVEVNRVFNMTYNGQPLSEGFVSVQAEFAELFYREIRYKLNQ